MSESTKNEKSSNSSTWLTSWAIGAEDSVNPGLPGMVECERCHKMEPDVAYVCNPYDADINDKIVMEWLCKACEDKYAADI